MSIYETFYMLAIAMIVLSVAVCEIITYELPNVLDSNMIFKKRDRTVLDENWLADNHCQCAYVPKNLRCGASRSDCLWYIIAQLVEDGRVEGLTK